jgi:hypothetical protein
MATESKAKWFEDSAEVIAFARILVDAEGTWSAVDVLRYLEKPWKWTVEHDRWIAMGRPFDIEEGALDEPEPASEEDEDELSLTPAGQSARVAGTQ